LPFSHPHAGATAVLVDEFDAGFFECSSHYSESRLAAIRAPTLKLTERCNTDARSLGELLLRPIKEPPGRPTLRRRYHLSLKNQTSRFPSNRLLFD
jgi:hypothetical protein